MNNLRHALGVYLALASRTTARVRSSSKGKSRNSLVLLGRPEAALRESVDELEVTDEFGTLIDETKTQFADDIHSAKREPSWRRAVQEFMRRSGTYTGLLRSSHTDAEQLLRRLAYEFSRREINVRYLAPLEFVEFENHRLDCGAFEIKRFAQDELDEEMGILTNRLFYPYAATNTSLLCTYSFLVANDTQVAPAVNSRVFFNVSEMDKVRSSYRPPPPPIEQALKCPSMFDWDKATDGWKSGGWCRFGLPVTLVVDDSLFRRPHNVPQLTALSTGPQAYADGEEYEERAVFFEVDDALGRDLETFCRQMRAVIDSLPSDGSWQFFDRAATYMVRAFLTNGLDQLLWHMTTLEALLGSGPDQPIMAPVRKRLATIVGSSAKEK